MSLPTKVLRRLQSRRTYAEVQLLSRPDCHLCDEAELLLIREFGAAHVEVVNILEDRDLEDRFVFRIPVLLYDGEVVAEGKFDRDNVRRARREIRQRQREGHASQ